MDSSRAAAVELSLVVWDERAAEAVDQRHVDAPPGLDVDGVRWFVEQRFGPVRGTVHVAEVAAEEHAGSAPSIGWTLPIEAVPELAREHPGASLVAVPFGRGPDGALLEMPGGAGRLADARPRLRTASRAGITFQVGGWLDRMLSEGHTFLLLEVGDHARYAQFATHDGSWLRGEVVGAVQVPDSPLSPSEEAAILDVGWHPPDDQPGSGAGGVNFWMEWGDPAAGEPVDVQDAAELAAATLCVAFEVRSPSQVRVETGTSRPGRLH